MKNLSVNLQTLTEAVKAIKETTGCYGINCAYKDLPGANTDFTTELVQLQMSEDSFINLIADLDLIDNVFYHTTNGRTYGFVDVAECQFFYICAI